MEEGNNYGISGLFEFLLIHCDCAGVDMLVIFLLRHYHYFVGGEWAKLPCIWKDYRLCLLKV